MVGPAPSDGPIRLGVGVTGMRARLEQFGGDLRIRTDRSGTGIVAIVPILKADRASLPAGRLRTPWLSGRAKDGEALS